MPDTLVCLDARVTSEGLAKGVDKCAFVKYEVLSVISSA